MKPGWFVLVALALAGCAKKQAPGQVAREFFDRIGHGQAGSTSAGN